VCLPEQSVRVITVAGTQKNRGGDFGNEGRWFCHYFQGDGRREEGVAVETIYQALTCAAYSGGGRMKKTIAALLSKLASAYHHQWMLDGLQKLDTQYEAMCAAFQGLAADLRKYLDENK